MQQPQPVVVAYVKPAVEVPRQPYHGAFLPRGRKLKVYRGGQPVRDREKILAAVGRRV